MKTLGEERLPMPVNRVDGSARYAHALPAGTSPAAENAGNQAGVSREDVTSPRAQSNLAMLADRLGMEPAALLAQITSGQDIRRLLSASAETGYGTSVAKSITGGIAIDQYA
jgi:hypothetical protein